MTPAMQHLLAQRTTAWTWLRALDTASGDVEKHQHAVLLQMIDALDALITLTEDVERRSGYHLVAVPWTPGGA